MTSLNVVALISGGKDSLFSILHCIANGHNVVALANLYPPEECPDDMNSFMYQTIGHNIIELISQSLELPLFRQPITGHAVNTNKSYEFDTKDEVESMYQLLLHIKQVHPEINALCTGAILSDYQRTRVESITSRLDMVSLSYLWQFPFLPPYDESILLKDMSEVGQDSRIIKIASGGLNKSYLWSNVADIETISLLEKAAARFGRFGDGAVVGEGGEYETLTIDGPWPLWKNRIEVLDQDRIVDTGDAGTAAIKIEKATLVKKLPPLVEMNKVRIPPIFDDVFLACRDHLLKGLMLDITNHIEESNSTGLECVNIGQKHNRNDRISPLTNITADGSTITEQIKGIMQLITVTHNIDPACIISTTILLKDMADFPTINSIYGSFFKTTNPPSRVTISCGNLLPPHVIVSVSITFCSPDLLRFRNGLHVQSQSYWAPANIGPYSQAITIPLSSSFPSSSSPNHQSSLIFPAGQIPLIPSSMTFFPKSSKTYGLDSTLLSLQHLYRIGQVMNVNIWLGGIAFIPHDHETSFIETIISAWRYVHLSPPLPASQPDSEADVDTFDVWDLTHGPSRFSTPRNEKKSLYRTGLQNHIIPPVFVAEVEELPRHACVEWSATGYRLPNRLGCVYKEQDEHGVEKRDVRFGMRRRSHGREERWVVDELQVVYDSKYDHEDEDDDDGQKNGGDGVRKCLKLAEWITFYTKEDMEDYFDKLVLGNDEHFGVMVIYTTGQIDQQNIIKFSPTIIPCYNLWNSDERRIYAVMSCINVQYNIHSCLI